MRVLRFLLRLLGWLLTPLVAWAASFLGAALGATLFGDMATATRGLAMTVAMGLAFALLGTHGWLLLVRRSPQLREALHLEADGAPAPTDPDPPPAETDRLE